MISVINEFITNNSSTIIVVILLLVLLFTIRIVEILKSIRDEIKFLDRRSEILLVNDELRHIPRNIKPDYFNKEAEDENY
jgi:Na+-transporting NADH:ubiquinone oxidoreductase subunit NqrC